MGGCAGGAIATIVFVPVVALVGGGTAAGGALMGADAHPASQKNPTRQILPVHFPAGSNGLSPALGTAATAELGGMLSLPKNTPNGDQSTSTTISGPICPHWPIRERKTGSDITLLVKSSTNQPLQLEKTSWSAQSLCSAHFDFSLRNILPDLFSMWAEVAPLAPRDFMSWNVPRD
jgi:hypothetical protein